MLAANSRREEVITVGRHTLASSLGCIGNSLHTRANCKLEAMSVGNHCNKGRHSRLHSA